MKYVYLISYLPHDQGNRTIEESNPSTWVTEPNEYDSFQAAKQGCDKINNVNEKVVAVVIRRQSDDH
jgi:hypothetical protein